jgi:hypothetical protein
VARRGGKEAEGVAGVEEEEEAGVVDGADVDGEEQILAIQPQ